MKKLLLGLGLTASGAAGFENAAQAKHAPPVPSKGRTERSTSSPEKATDIQELKNQVLVLLGEYFQNDQDATAELRLEADQLLATEKNPVKQIDLLKKFYENRRLVARRQTQHGGGGRQVLEAEAAADQEEMTRFLSPTVSHEEALRALTVIIPEQHELSWNHLFTIRRGKGMDFFEGDKKIDVGTRQEMIRRYVHLLEIRRAL